MPTIRIDAGDQTEDLLLFITSQLDDATLDEIDIQREGVKSDNLATEPFTAAATLALATTAIVSVSRIIERWLENRRQLEHLHIIANGFTKSDEAGRALSDVSKAHAKVSVAYGLQSRKSK